MLPCLLHHSHCSSFQPPPWRPFRFSSSPSLQLISSSLLQLFVLPQHLHLLQERTKWISSLLREVCKLELWFDLPLRALVIRHGLGISGGVCMSEWVWKIGEEGQAVSRSEDEAWEVSKELTFNSFGWVNLFSTVMVTVLAMTPAFVTNPVMVWAGILKNGFEGRCCGGRRRRERLLSSFLSNQHWPRSWEWTERKKKSSLK